MNLQTKQQVAIKRLAHIDDLVSTGFHIHFPIGWCKTSPKGNHHHEKLCTWKHSKPLRCYLRTEKRKNHRRSLPCMRSHGNGFEQSYQVEAKSSDWPQEVFSLPNPKSTEISSLGKFDSQRFKAIKHSSQWKLWPKVMVRFLETQTKLTECLVILDSVVQFTTWNRRIWPNMLLQDTIEHQKLCCQVMNTQRQLMFGRQDARSVRFFQEKCFSLAKIILNR